MHDAKANTIDSLIMHLGDAGRKNIKVHELKYYIEIAWLKSRLPGAKQALINLESKR